MFDADVDYQFGATKIFLKENQDRHLQQVGSFFE